MTIPLVLRACFRSAACFIFVARYLGRDLSLYFLYFSVSSSVLPGGALDGPGVERGLAQRADTKSAGCHLGANRDRSSLHSDSQSDTRREYLSYRLVLPNYTFPTTQNTQNATPPSSNSSLTSERISHSQLFLNCLLNLQSNSILNEIDTERLFCNIPEIYTANRIFWHENINAVVKASRESGNPLDPDMMLNGFIKVRLLIIC